MVGGANSCGERGGGGETLPLPLQYGWERRWAVCPPPAVGRGARTMRSSFGGQSKAWNGGLQFLYGALDCHLFFPSRAASRRCVVTTAAAGVPCGVVSASVEPSSWCTGNCAGCCGSRCAVFAAHSPPRSGRPPPPFLEPAATRASAVIDDQRGAIHSTRAAVPWAALALIASYTQAAKKDRPTAVAGVQNGQGHGPQASPGGPRVWRDAPPPPPNKN